MTAILIFMGIVFTLVSLMGVLWMITYPSIGAIVYTIGMLVATYTCFSNAYKFHKKKQILQRYGKNTWVKVVDYGDGNIMVNGVPNVILITLGYVDNKICQLSIPTTRYDVHYFPLGCWVFVRYCGADAKLIGKTYVDVNEVDKRILTQVDAYLNAPPQESSVQTIPQ